VEGLFTGPTAIAFIYSSEPQGAKVVLDAVRALRKERVVVTGGIIGNQALDAAGVERLTTMEPREQQLPEVLGAMQASASRRAAAWKGATQGRLYPLMALGDRREQQGGEGRGSSLSGEELLDAVGSLTVRDAVVLTRAIQERFGVAPSAITATIEAPSSD